MLTVSVDFVLLEWRCIVDVSANWKPPVSGLFEILTPCCRRTLIIFENQLNGSIPVSVGKLSNLGWVVTALVFASLSLM
jgi:hypothetical protein